MEFFIGPIESVSERIVSGVNGREGSNESVPQTDSGWEWREWYM